VTRAGRVAVNRHRKERTVLDSRIPRLSSPSIRFAAVVAVAVAVAAALVAASLLGARDSGTATAPTAATLLGAEETEALLRGIPQTGTALGSPDAPVTLVEYADLQCPYCAVWAHDAFPALVRDYVRAGRLRVEFRGLAFLGPESDTALRAALAAGAQNKLWNVLHLLFGNQGQENGGWVSEELLRALGPSIRGLDAERMLDEREAAAVERALQNAAVDARRAGVTGTPSFELGPTGSRLERLEVSSLDASAFARPIDEALRRA
jgi:protein-disulfide isomerase